MGLHRIASAEASQCETLRRMGRDVSTANRAAGYQNRLHKESCAINRASTTCEGVSNWIRLPWR